jgi:hypothetical protein
VNFGGKAMDPQGKAISGIAGITFAIYKDQTEGSPLWLETQNVTADAKGNYAVQLGATKSEGLPLDLFTSGEGRWLGVRVNGGPEQPRVLLLSVPYALKAADAETVGGLPASAFMLAASAQPGPAIAGAAISSSGSAVPPPATVTGAGAANFVPLWTGASTVADSVLYQSGTSTTAKVGINTTAPAATLDVKGTATIRGVLALPPPAAATAAAGKTSQPLNFTTSAFNSATSTAVGQTFRLASRARGQQHERSLGDDEPLVRRRCEYSRGNRPQDCAQRTNHIRTGAIISKRGNRNQRGTDRSRD